MHHQPQPTPSSSTGGLTNKDIACGRGRRLEQHTGNTIFRSFIQQVSLEYSHNTTSRSRKALISKSIRIRIEDEGMRFVKKDKANDVWRELSLPEIKLKIGHAIRDCKQPRTLPTISSKAKQCIAGIHQHSTKSRTIAPANEEPPMNLYSNHDITMSTPQSALAEEHDDEECDEYFTVMSMGSRDTVCLANITTALSPEQEEIMEDFMMKIQNGMSSSDFSSYIMADDDHEEPTPVTSIPAEDVSSDFLAEQSAEYSSDVVDLLVEMCDAGDLVLLSQLGSTDDS